VAKKYSQPAKRHPERSFDEVSARLGLQVVERRLVVDQWMWRDKPSAGCIEVSVGTPENEVNYSTKVPESVRFIGCQLPLYLSSHKGHSGKTDHSRNA
jgi:hypothetical protein